MKRLITAACLIFMISQAAFAEKPSITIVGKKKVISGSDILLAASDTKGDKDFPIQWQIINSNASLIVYNTSTLQGGAAGILDAQPGTIIVAATAYGMVDGSKFPQAATAVHVITVIDSVPIPTPPPTPGPPPVPIPEPVESGRLFVTLLWTSESDTTASVLARTTQAIKEQLKSLDCIWTAIDLDSEIGKRYTQIAKDIKPPVIIVQIGTGKVVKSFTPTDNPLDIIKAVKGLR